MTDSLKHKKTQKPKVFLMLSGGVDSSVAGHILANQNYHVTAIYMKCWSMQQIQKMGLSQDLYACNWEDDILDASSVAKKIGINFEVWDLQTEYLDHVVNYMLFEYNAGRTPNPDVMCNSSIKFGVFYDQAMRAGADYVASGHYARIAKITKSERKSYLESNFQVIKKSNSSEKVANIDSNENSLAIHKGLDKAKDQAYFLWKIKQQQIPKILFPIGEFTDKSKVREYALEHKLITADKKDSQGLCFIGKTSLRELLLQKLGKKPGLIVTSKIPKNYKINPKLQKLLTSQIQDQPQKQSKTQSKNLHISQNLEKLVVLGEHLGAHTYTIGQREKLGIHGGPWFVEKIDIHNNLLYVAHQQDKQRLESQSLILTEFNWQIPIQEIQKYNQKNLITAQIRYHGEFHKTKITFLSKNQDTQITNLKSNSLQKAMQVDFSTPVQSPAKGQSVVFYKDQIMLGGAIIQEIL